MADLENGLNGAVQQDQSWLSSEDMSVWVNANISNWGQGSSWSGKRTLDDGSVVMVDGATLTPSNYMMYLAQLMINKNS